MKRFSRLIGFIIVFITATAAFCTVSFAATVGQQLPGPEAGWQRIDNIDKNIKYNGPWTSGYYTDNGNYWGGAGIFGSYLESNIHFKFYGTKLRILNSKAYDRYDGIRVSIDGVAAGTINQYMSTGGYHYLLFEKTGLSLGIHDVVISPPASAPSSDKLRLYVWDLIP